MENTERTGEEEAKTLVNQVFDLAAVAFRAEPTDAHFASLYGAKPANLPFAVLTDVTYEVARREAFNVPAVGYLAKALAMEHRLQEAHHFCQRWIESAPNDVEAHRLAVLIACQRIDVPSARRSFRALQTAGAKTGTLHALETIMLLAFWEGRDADTTARLALEAGGDLLAPAVASDAAFRLDDVELLIQSYCAAPELADEKGREPWARNLLRSRLVNVLRGRSADR